MNSAIEEKMSVAPNEPLEALDECVGSSDKLCGPRQRAAMDPAFSTGCTNSKFGAVGVCAG
jgi:hypothetical protein